MISLMVLDRLMLHPIGISLEFGYSQSYLRISYLTCYQHRVHLTIDLWLIILVTSDFGQFCKYKGCFQNVSRQRTFQHRINCGHFTRTKVCYVLLCFEDVDDESNIDWLSVMLLQSSRRQTQGVFVRAFLHWVSSERRRYPDHWKPFCRLGSCSGWNGESALNTTAYFSLTIHRTGSAAVHRIRYLSHCRTYHSGLYSETMSQRYHPGCFICVFCHSNEKSN